MNRAEPLSPETWDTQCDQACEALAPDTDPAKVIAQLGHSRRRVEHGRIRFQQR